MRCGWRWPRAWRISSIAGRISDWAGSLSPPSRRLPISKRPAAAELVSGRWMEPEEIAAAILFLCSDAASGINGGIINVNGGDYMPH